jgi:WhiB family redox-sensing transcriptional regulator
LELKDWYQHGLCKDKETALFYPETGDNTLAKKAMTLCKACPVRAECLSYALSNNESFGVWGGFTVRRRGRLRRVIGKPYSVESCRKYLNANSSV